MSIDPGQSSCLTCLRAHLMTVTSDTTALSDVGRPHKAFRNAYDRTKVGGQYREAEFPVKPLLITWNDTVAWLDAMKSIGMKPTTVAVYRYTLERAWAGVTCRHGITGTGVESGGTGKLDGGVGELETVTPTFGSSVTVSSPNNMRLLNLGGTEIGRTGFKLSVCQKSLSLALKHAWAHGFIDTPPVSPVDRIVLVSAAKITRRTWHTNWTDVNSLEQYDAHLDLLQAAAGFRDLASWEIMIFERLLPVRRDWTADEVHELSVDAQERIPLAKKEFVKRFEGVEIGSPWWKDLMLKDAIKSSLQHNPTYLPTTTESERAQVRQAMRNYIIGFLVRWEGFPSDARSLTTFKEEMLVFRETMNRSYGQYFK